MPNFQVSLPRAEAERLLANVAEANSNVSEYLRALFRASEHTIRVPWIRTEIKAERERKQEKARKRVTKGAL